MTLYSVAKTHRMPKVAGHVSPKGPFGAKGAINYRTLLRIMTCSTVFIAQPLYIFMDCVHNL